MKQNGIKDLTPEEITKNDELTELEYQDNLLYGPQYGPSGKNKNNEIEGGQHLISSINRLAGESYSWDYEDYHKEGDSSIGKYGNAVISAQGSAGAGGAIASGNFSYSGYREATDAGEARFLSFSTGGEIGHGLGGTTAKVNLGFDVASIETKGCQLRVGPNLDTGGSVGPGGVEAKIAGVGVSIGKKMGLSTPLGGFSVDLEEASESCVVQ